MPSQCHVSRKRFHLAVESGIAENPPPVRVRLVDALPLGGVIVTEVERGILTWVLTSGPGSLDADLA
jgi:hypothetical protein